MWDSGCCSAFLTTRCSAEKLLLPSVPEGIHSHLTSEQNVLLVAETAQNALKNNLKISNNVVDKSTIPELIFRIKRIIFSKNLFNVG